VNRPGFPGGSTFQVEWSGDEQSDERIQPCGSCLGGADGPGTPLHKMKKNLALGINLSLERSMGQEIDGKDGSSDWPIRRPPLTLLSKFAMRGWHSLVWERFFVMKIMQFAGAAAILTMLGGAVASANTLPAQQSRQLVALQQSDVTTLQVFAGNSPQGASVLAAPQVTQQPRKLPLADFGQWDEAGSEN
jgi:hypothetical protein